MRYNFFGRRRLGFVSPLSTVIPLGALRSVGQILGEISGSLLNPVSPRSADA